MSYSPTVTYPNNGFALALRTVAGAIVNGIGSRVYYVQTSGYDTHAEQGAGGGSYGTLMGTLGDGLAAFYNDVRNRGLAGDTTVIVFSEFGRRISENGRGGTDHAGWVDVVSVARCAAGSTARPPRWAGRLRRSRTIRRRAIQTDFRSVYLACRPGRRRLGADLNGDFAPVLRRSSNSCRGLHAERERRVCCRCWCSERRTVAAQTRPNRIRRTPIPQRGPRDLRRCVVLQYVYELTSATATSVRLHARYLDVTGRLWTASGALNHQCASDYGRQPRR